MVIIVQLLVRHNEHWTYNYYSIHERSKQVLGLAKANRNLTAGTDTLWMMNLFLVHTNLIKQQLGLSKSNCNQCLGFCVAGNDASWTLNLQALLAYANFIRQPLGIAKPNPVERRHTVL